MLVGGIRMNIRDFRNGTVENRASGGSAVSERQWVCAAKNLGDCRRQSVLGCEVDKLSVETGYPAVRGFAQAGHMLGDGIEYRLCITGRVGDDAEHFGGRSLLLPRLGEFARARIELAFQLASVRLELLFRRSLRFLRPAELTHAGRPKAEDPPIRKHSTLGPLLCEAVHSAGP